MRKIVTMLFCTVLGISQLAAQNRTVKGKVTDEKGDGITQASILVKGTTIGTNTQNDGTYSLLVPPTAKTLVVSSLGFTLQEISIGTKSEINVLLQSSTQNLDEVVVVGYGTQKKINSTASTVKIGGDKLSDKPFASIDQMLQGAAAGVQSIASTGQPGANQQIRIRGIGSFSLGASQPLFVIDGVIMNGGDLSNGNGGGFNINPSTNVLATLNSDDVESISILKDAAATSIYGSRGGNGVILITTKSGKIGKTQFKLSTDLGINSVILPPPAGRPIRANDWFTLLKEGLRDCKEITFTISGL